MEEEFVIPVDIWQKLNDKDFYDYLNIGKSLIRNPKAKKEYRKFFEAGFGYWVVDSVDVDIYNWLYEIFNKMVVVTITIKTTPNDAVVKLNGIEQCEISVPCGTKVYVEISKNGYTTIEETIVASENIVEEYILEKEEIIGYQYQVITYSENSEYLTIHGEYFESMVVEENGKEMINETTTGIIPYIFETDNRRVMVKFKSEIVSLDNCFGSFEDSNKSRYFIPDLIEIPENLFESCPNVISFNNCFESCVGLTSIPLGLFDNFPNAIDFRNCFKYCSLTGETPSTKGIKLWERAGNKDYPTIINGDGCFESCTELNDYANIPSNWK